MAVVSCAKAAPFTKCDKSPGGWILDGTCGMLHCFQTSSFLFHILSCYHSTNNIDTAKLHVYVMFFSQKAVDSTVQPRYSSAGRLVRVPEIAPWHRFVIPKEEWLWNLHGLNPMIALYYLINLNVRTPLNLDSI